MRFAAEEAYYRECAYQSEQEDYVSETVVDVQRRITTYRLEVDFVHSGLGIDADASYMSTLAVDKVWMNSPLAVLIRSLPLEFELKKLIEIFVACRCLQDR
jgi:hypothetical protein